MFVWCVCVCICACGVYKGAYFDYLFRFVPPLAGDVGSVFDEIFSKSLLASLHNLCDSFNHSERHNLREGLLQIFFNSFARSTSPSVLHTIQPILLKLQVKCPHALRVCTCKLMHDFLLSGSSSSPQRFKPQQSFLSTYPWSSQNCSLQRSHFRSFISELHFTHNSPSSSLGQQ